MQSRASRRFWGRGDFAYSYVSFNKVTSLRTVLTFAEACAL